MIVLIIVLFFLPIAGCSTGERKPSSTQDASAMPAPECASTYAKFFAKDSVTITVALGYMDTGWGSDTANNSMRSTLVEKFTSYNDLCRQSSQPYACDFRQAPGNPSLFVKKIRGPDGKQKTVQIQFVDAISSSGSQVQASDQAEEEFLSSLSQSDAVFYLGHSRAGGGPDFNPPRLLPNGDRDYAWYKRHEPGFHAVELALSQSTEHTKLLGLLSCDSGGHFSEELHHLAPETALIVSEAEVEFEEQQNSLIGAIDGLLGMKCHDDFVKNLQFVDLSSGKNPNGILQLVGFFQ